MEALRIGILGASRIAVASMIEPARITGTRLVAVAARDRDRAEAYAAEHGVERVLDSYHDVVHEPEVEAIYNPLANSLHGPWNIAAIDAGRHVLSEKPFASNAEEATEVRDAGKLAGVHVVEGFHYAYHPLLHRLHAVLASGELGELRSAVAMVAIPPPPPTDPRWSLPLGGGALMDLGCYSLHAMRALAPFAGGEPMLVAARGAARDGLRGVDEWMDAELVFPSGVTGLARCNMSARDRDIRLHVVGSDGQADVDNFAVPHDNARIMIKTRQDERVEEFGDRSSYTYQLEAFTALVRDGVPMPTDSDDAVRNMQLMDDCYRAAGFEPRPRSPRAA